MRRHSRSPDELAAPGTFRRTEVLRSPQQGSKRKGVLDMQANELLQRIESKDAPLIVDVRTEREFKNGHIPGAVSAPLGKILVHSADLPHEQAVITCKGGERAWIARKLLAHRGYDNIESLDGHMKHWKQAGLPLET